MYAQLAPEHHRAVERVIHAMRESSTDPLSLSDMADLACLSPFHFCRVFRAIVGIPPIEFQAALRLETAKHLLINTSLSVTDICFTVGYSSLGAFTSRFTRLVGLPPHRLRMLASDFAPPPLDMPISASSDAGWMPLRSGVTGCISAPAGRVGPIFVGLFPKPIPQSIPSHGAILAAPGPYRIAPVPDGRYYLLVAALHPTKTPFASLLSDDDLLVGAASRPVVVSGGATRHPVNIHLRPPAMTDPPVLISLPLLLVRATTPALASAR